jgi:hypothetical protein
LAYFIVIRFPTAPAVIGAMLESVREGGNRDEVRIGGREKSLGAIAGATL